MNIPIVLSVVHIEVTADGHLRVDVDGKPYADDRKLSRGDLRAIVDEISGELGTAVRVEVREADGSTYSDIETPQDRPVPEAEDQASGPETATPALTGAGFHPGEEVALAYVVVRQVADKDGNASVNLPPALVTAAREGLVLLGLGSLTVAPLESA